MIIAAAGQKGGSGKTTVALNIADELYRRNHATLLIDADPQGSAITAASLRDDETGGPDIQAMPALLEGDWKNARANLVELAEDYTHIVIDPPPQNLSPQRVVMANADLVILPCGATSFDLWSIADVLELVHQYQEAREGFRSKLLLNQVRSGTRLSREVAAALEDVDIPVFDTRLSLLVDFAESPGRGIGVTRYAEDGKAARQVRHLVDEILAR